MTVTAAWGRRPRSASSASRGQYSSRLPATMSRGTSMAASARKGALPITATGGAISASPVTTASASCRATTWAATVAPKEYPASARGTPAPVASRRWVTAASMSRCSSRPPPWIPVERPTPRKLKRRVAKPNSAQTSTTRTTTGLSMSPPDRGWGWQITIPPDGVGGRARRASRAAPSLATRVTARSGIIRGREYRWRSEEHTSELQSPCNLVCRLLLEKKKKNETNEGYVDEEDRDEYI